MVDFGLIAPSVVITFRNDVYDFTKLRPAKNGVSYDSRLDIVDDCCAIMRYCGYPFDFRCPAPVIFANHRYKQITWRSLAYILWFVVDFANNYSFEPWNRNLKWLGYQFQILNSPVGGNDRLFNVSLRLKDSDDIVCSVICPRNQLELYVTSYLDKHLSNSYIYIY